MSLTQWTDERLLPEFEPQEHQKRIIRFVEKNKRSIVVAEPGAGKTGALLSVIDEAMGIDINRVLVVSTSNIAKAVWQNEAAKFKNFAGIKVVRLMGLSSHRARLSALKGPGEVFTINIHSLQCVLDMVEMGEIEPFDMVILDESTLYKNTDSTWSLKAYHAAELAERVVLLTGTPTPNGLKNMISQLYIVTGRKRFIDTFFDDDDLHNFLTLYTTFRDLGPWMQLVIDAVPEFARHLFDDGLKLNSEQRAIRNTILGGKLTDYAIEILLSGIPGVDLRQLFDGLATRVRDRWDGGTDLMICAAMFRRKFLASGGEKEGAIREVCELAHAKGLGIGIQVPDELAPLDEVPILVKMDPKGICEYTTRTDAIVNATHGDSDSMTEQRNRMLFSKCPQFANGFSYAKEKFRLVPKLWRIGAQKNKPRKAGKRRRYRRTERGARIQVTWKRYLKRSYSPKRFYTDDIPTNNIDFFDETNADGKVINRQRPLECWSDVKLDELGKILDHLDGEPLLVFCHRRYDVARIVDRFGAREISEDNGGFKAWNSGKVRCAVVMAQSVAHGIQLQYGGSNIAWFGLTVDLEVYEQANARVRRKGQTEQVTSYLLITQDTIDEEIYKRIKNKRVRMGMVIAGFQGDWETLDRLSKQYEAKNDDDLIANNVARGTQLRKLKQMQEIDDDDLI